ncbi:conserved phage C-terminal domain-containing protein [Brevibacillus laterosporus]|uniref:conserved phage C-terminal domain-containing protein n=1 Tax=Brevibacillus laterosporus TaxID=1465 RepID=UPI003D24B862
MSTQLEDGFTRIANKILEDISKISLNGTQFRIVLTVWRFTYGFQRKEHELSIAFLAKSTEIARGQVDRELTALIERKILTVVRTGRRGSRVIMFNKNSEEWNDRPPIRGLSSKTRTELSANSRTLLSSKTRNKKESIKEKDKDNMSCYEEIISYLNEKAGKRFSHKSPANRKLINGRLAEDRTIDDFKYVIDVKCNHWLGDPEMEDYLRPATLFAQKNFENYLNQKVKQKVIKQDPRDKETEFQRWVQGGNDPDEFDWS